MALQLFKLASEAFPTLSATTSQAAIAYFRTVTAGGISVAANSTYTLAAASWVDENGSAVAAFATAAGLNLLFSNGVLQQPSLYTISAAAVVLAASATPLVLTSGVPLVLQTYNANAAITASTLVSSRIAIP